MYLLLPIADIFHQLKVIHNTTKYAPHLRWSHRGKSNCLVWLNVCALRLIMWPWISFPHGFFTPTKYGTWVVKCPRFSVFLVSHLSMQIYACIHLPCSLELSLLCNVCHIGFSKVPYFRKCWAFSPIWYSVKVTISRLVRCKDSELACEHARTTRKCFWRGKPLFMSIAMWQYDKSHIS